MSGDTKNCIQCNGEMGIDGIICRHCGAIQPESGAAVSPENATGHLKTCSQQDNSSKPWKTWLGNVGTIVFLFDCWLICRKINSGSLPWQLVFYILAAIVVFTVIVVARKGLLVTTIASWIAVVTFVLLGLAGQEVLSAHEVSDSARISPYLVITLIIGGAFLVMAILGTCILAKDRKQHFKNIGYIPQRK